MTSDFTVNDHNDPYVEARDGNLYIRGTRVQFESIIRYWQQGQTPDDLHRAFPSVPLAASYGAIAFYLGHQTEADAFLDASAAEWARLRAAAEAADPERYASLRRRFAEARARLEASESASAEAGSPIA
jgi:uncharacterized protein (DUF433 family)